MGLNAIIASLQMGDISAASSTIRSFEAPLILALAGTATLVCSFFLTTAGFSYITSSGRPDKIEHAKRVMRNALLGLVIILGASVLTGVLSGAYLSPVNSTTASLPSLTTVAPASTGNSLVSVLVDAIVGLFQIIIQSAAAPFIAALSYFTHGTPLMTANTSVFDLWLGVTAMTDALFVLVVVFLGFHVMSAATLGIDEIEFKHLLPQLGLGFLLINSSIFIVDGFISLSNIMITALYNAFPVSSVWASLTGVVSQSSSMGIVALLIMLAFVILTVILLVYYVTRLVTLYLGAILSPLVMLLWLIPGFKDFAITAIRSYLSMVFVLFVHVVILLLAASIFAGMAASSPNQTLNPVMASIVGLATITALIKTQGVMMQLSYISVGPRAVRKLGGQFMTGVSQVTRAASSAAVAE